ncbi:MAG TPA: DUF6515 family protein [Chitinophagaceae bacterium]|jgi:hypothetical protein|nr:DUF6515 family protein [Chitinophagaceae bacterium]
MKTQRYTYIFLLTLFVSFAFSSTSFAQRGRYNYNRGYHQRYYSQRSYSYVRPYVSVHFGGYDYRYHHGYFYRPYGSVFQVVVPPFGIRIATLPYGYRSFYIGPHPYYYYNGTYYRPYANEYEVIAPPLGAVVDELPPGAKPKVIDGQKYYELNGTYYKEELDANNRLSYSVVGTDGVLNAEREESVSSEPMIGDRIDNLPADSKTVVIRGEKLYSTPSGLYYKEVVEGNKVYYELVGK